MFYYTYDNSSKYLDLLPFLSQHLLLDYHLMADFPTPPWSKQNVYELLLPE